jgi:hypothetical protein
MDTAVELLEKVKALGVTLTPSGDKLLLEPGSKVPPDLVRQIREHKTEILAHLSKPKLVDAPPQWHAETIAHVVEREGVCIFWSELFGEMIAFVKGETFKNRVPCGLVTYSSKELKELFGEGKPWLSARDLRLIHEAKRAGGHIASHQDSRGQG